MLSRARQPTGEAPGSDEPDQQVLDDAPMGEQALVGSVVHGVSIVVRHPHETQQPHIYPLLRQTISVIVARSDEVCAMASASSDPAAIIAETLRDKRPLVLFAGQSIDRSHEPILRALLERLNCADCTSGWRSALDRGMTKDDVAWLSERFDRSVHSDAAAPIFDVTWSAVFTSSLDPQFRRRFETRGRQPEAVLWKHAHARVPRSRSRPPVYYLLGKSDETVAEARAPRTRTDLTRRVVGHATELLNRIAETATVRGLVVIAGYCPDRDMMPADNLLAPLSTTPSPAVVWYGAPDRLDSDLAESMIRAGTLITAKCSLTDALGRLELRGEIDLVESAAPDEPGLVTLSGGAVLDLTPALRLRVEASAAIVDDEWTEDPEPLAESESDDAFRRFHGTFGDFRLLVSGVSRGYSIEREFEQRLWTTVIRTLETLGRHGSDDVIILHGQSGTGKTIALARLIRRLRIDRRLPVAVATHRIPNHTDIEAFCLEAERLDAKATVLICDCNQPPQRYREMGAALRSRGRRLLIVGTCYRLATSATARFVEAPAQVSPAERSSFDMLRKRFCPRVVLSEVRSTDAIFAMLYRSLPVARGTLAAGIASEARTVAGELRERAHHTPTYTTDLPAKPRRSRGSLSLAQQLIDLRLVPPDWQPFQDDAAWDALEQDAAGRLIEYVMVAGRVNCPVPMNLILRLLSDDESLDADYIKFLFSDLDLLRTIQDREGSDYLLAPRLQLEADLICRRRLTPATEIDRLTDLIRHARPGVDQHIERTFLLSLLYNVDRRGPREEAYRDGYLRFADALQQRREQYRTAEPDLVLRECVLRRRAVRLPDKFHSGDSVHERFAILDEARDAIERTLREIEAGDVRVTKWTKQSLVTERAAIYGYLAVQKARHGGGNAVWSDYLAARAATNRVVGVGGSLYPIHIALWTARDVLIQNRGELTMSRTAELRADLYANIDYADDLFGIKRRLQSSNLSQDHEEPDEGLGVSDDLVEYLDLRSGVADALGDCDLDEQMLKKFAPQAATFLIARRRAEKLGIVSSLSKTLTSLYVGESPFDSETRDLAADTADYMCSQVDAEVKLDDRCQRLLLTLRWAHATGERLMFRPRGRTPAGEKYLFELRQTVSMLNGAGSADARIRERYLEALLSWLLNDVNYAFDLWRSLSDDTDYQDPHRTVRWHLVTDEQGSPRRYRGRVEVSGANHKMQVEGVERPISLSLRDFPSDEIEHGRELRDFGIAFNYIGPIADPLGRHSPRRR